MARQDAVKPSHYIQHRNSFHAPTGLGISRLVKGVKPATKEEQEQEQQTREHEEEKT